ncbi:hypothetical protein HDU97_006253 [Phlyctochytrium planicorne]|nr:hypothetical protein HDU97_006253 [Phlyctochytrium planicorne]
MVLDAVKAAVEFLNKAKCELSVSIATGNVFFGDLGGEGRKETGFLGDVVNLAVRLLGIKREQDCVAIDKTTKDIVPPQVKGKEQKVEVWAIKCGECSSLREAPKSVNKTIGNGIEFESLKKAFEDWRNSETKRFRAFIDGKSGMGKSSLLAMLQEYFRERHVEICLTRGTEIEQRSPYSTLQFLLQTILSHTLLEKQSEVKRSHSLRRSQDMRRKSGDFNEDSRLRKLLIEVGEDPSYYSLFNDIICMKRATNGQGGNSWADDDKVINLDSEGRRTVLRDIVTKVVCHLIKKFPMAIVVDDAQWVDPVSLDIICNIAETSENVFLLIFSRPLKEEAAFRISNIDFEEKLELKGLQASEIEEYLRLYLTNVKITRKLVESLHSQTGGNLLQVDTLVKFLAEETENHPQTTESILEIVSTKIETLLMVQFDRLDPFLQTVYKLGKTRKIIRKAYNLIASILGQYFIVDDLLYLLDDPNQSEATLCDLIIKEDRFGFMVVEKGGHGLHSWFKVHFRHAIIVSSIYESMSVMDRERLHTRVAEFYEVLVEKDISEKKNADKIVSKNFELGMSLFNDSLYIECTKVLSDLFSYICAQETSPDLGVDNVKKKQYLSSSPVNLIANADRSELLAKLSWSSASLLPLPVVRQYAIESLELSGIRWPKSPSELQKSILGMIWRFCLYWKRSRKGLVDIQHWDIDTEDHDTQKVGQQAPVPAPTAPKTAKKEYRTRTQKIMKRESLYPATESEKPVRIKRNSQQQWHLTVKTALQTMTLLTILDRTTEPMMSLLVILRTVNHALLRAHSDPDNAFYSILLSAFAFCKVNNAFWLARMLFSACVDIVRKCSWASRAHFHLFGALYLGLWEDPRQAHAMSCLFKEYWVFRKVNLENLKGLVFSFPAQFFMGMFDRNASKSNVQMIEDMVHRDATWAVGAIVTLQIESFCRGDLEALLIWNQLISQIQRVSPAAVTPVFGYTAGLHLLMEEILKGGVLKCFMKRLQPEGGRIGIEKKTSIFRPFIAINESNEVGLDILPLKTDDNDDDEDGKVDADTQRRQLLKMPARQPTLETQPSQRTSPPKGDFLDHLIKVAHQLSVENPNNSHFYSFLAAVVVSIAVCELVEAIQYFPAALSIPMTTIPPEMAKSSPLAGLKLCHPLVLLKHILQKALTMALTSNRIYPCYLANKFLKAMVLHVQIHIPTMPLKAMEKLASSPNSYVTPQPSTRCPKANPRLAWFERYLRNPTRPKILQPRIGFAPGGEWVTLGALVHGFTGKLQAAGGSNDVGAGNEHLRQSAETFKVIRAKGLEKWVNGDFGWKPKPGKEQK